MQMCDRYFSQDDIDWIRAQVDTLPDLTRVELSRRFCRQVGWYKPDGGLKDMSCRVALLRLERAGLIRLPSPRSRVAALKKIQRTPAGAPQAPVVIDESEKLAIVPVDANTAALWKELIDRYHYLGYRTMVGAQMRFFVHAQTHCVALLGFAAAAWRVAPRDAFIGWSQAQRKANLHRVVDNSRFLILPWVRGGNLASRILSRAARYLPEAWQARYHYRPVLLETFVETPRFTGACYRAANWTCVGQSRGRGKWDRRHTAEKPAKTIWLYPLEPRFQEVLCR